MGNRQTEKKVALKNAKKTRFSSVTGIAGFCKDYVGAEKNFWARKSLDTWPFPPIKKILIVVLIFSIFEILSIFSNFWGEFLGKKQQFCTMSTRLRDRRIFPREGAVKKFFSNLIYPDRSPWSIKMIECIFVKILQIKFWNEKIFGPTNEFFALFFYFSPFFE